MFKQLHRPRRNRKSAAIRNLSEETQLTVNDLILPLFLVEGSKQKQPIEAMPGVYRYSMDELQKVVARAKELG
ncbi:MAG: delta-aminolevulinic acid dehydratase, partial [Bdellovibrionaceae bacterium]|nr:delta-aminolevulinic acid dehydratase [Pseudobdellovibrionaceae bacterium]